MAKLVVVDESTTVFDPSWTVAEYASRMPPRTWEQAFAEAESELETVSEILSNMGEFYPRKEDIFNAFNYTPLDQVKVVIVGQDPYHQAVKIGGKLVPRATGLSFSVRREDEIPVSLNNIFKELNTSTGVHIPDNGDLTEWARQGVLMLNMCLTVTPNMAGSHKDIWLGFVNKIIKAIDAVNPNCIYVMWGKKAQQIAEMLGEKNKQLTAPHPSGFSARTGFFGCNHFTKINEMLIAQNKTPINWNLSSNQEMRRTVKVRLESRPNDNRVRKLLPINTDDYSDSDIITQEPRQRIVPRRAALVNLDIPHAINSSA